MTALAIREVNRQNWRAALTLTVHPEQQRFVSGYTPIAAIALAKAYVRPGGLTWLPYLIYASEQPIGMVVLAYAPGSDDRYWLYHFFIDRAHQGNGHSKPALHTFIALVRAQHPACHQLNLTVHPDNDRAQRLYTGVGFQPTGETQDGEPVYRLKLASTEAGAAD